MKQTIKRIVIGILSLVLLAAAALHLIAVPAPDHPFFDQFENYPLVIAHAGSELYPTDTLYALENYADMGVDILEMDVHMTADKQIILIHDHTVDRTTDGSGDVREMTLVELQALDAGYYWTNDDGETYPFRDQGIVIPTLEEVFQTFPDYPMIIEIKQDSPSMEQELCSLLREYNMDGKVMIPSFSDTAMARFRQACPETATAASSGEVRDFVYRNFALMAGTISPQYYALQVPEKSDGIPVVTRLLLFFAKWRNVQVHIWTINDPEQMERFIDMGVDGIMTDRTDLLLEILGR
ncbi:MAG: glycerophosphodiester phosphodiesterase [Chloroflexota bacterium]